MKLLLPPEKLESLLPYLRSVADLIKDHDEIRDSDLRVMLSGSELNDDASLDELMQWATILLAAKGATEVKKLEVTKELMRRGIPEAPARLAVHRVAPFLSEQVPIQVSSSVIYFGTLRPHQSARKTLKVRRGSGKVRVSSDLIRVSPEHFGPHETTLTIKVQGCISDSILWENIVLENETEKVLIVVIAEWEGEESELCKKDALEEYRVDDSSTLKEATEIAPFDATKVLLENETEKVQVEPITHLQGEAHKPVHTSAYVVDPSGSGHYRTLQEAIELAPPNATLILTAGIHRLPISLTLSKSITLTGAGAEETKVISEAEGYVVKFSGDGVFTLENIALIHEGEKWANVVVVDKGHTEFRNCRFEGGVREKRSKKGGCGLWFHGTATGLIQHCLFTNNECHGIEVSWQAQPRLISNTCERNGDCGIAYFGFATGEALANTCRENGNHGIHIGEHAQPKLEANVCERNKLIGIAYFTAASGEAYSNICRENEQHGIYVSDHAQPYLERNTCERNQWQGLAYFGTASGEGHSNICRENGVHGIYIGEQAQPRLEGNTCERNKQSGLAYFGSAAGAAYANTCRENEQHGIYISDHAQPYLERNTCERNQWQGLAYFGTASGLACSNTCCENQQNGICVGEQAQPHLEGNTCERNKQSGLAYFGSAAGAAYANTCCENEWNGIYVGESAQPLVEGNTCDRNKWSGLVYSDFAAGAAHANTCRKNGVHGIYIGEQAQPRLEGNICEGNTDCGLAYFGSAAGAAYANTCRENEKHGIYVDEQAQPHLEGNLCEWNKNYGIYVDNHAQPILLRNICRSNLKGGIHKRRRGILGWLRSLEG